MVMGLILGRALTLAKQLFGVWPGVLMLAYALGSLPAQTPIAASPLTPNVPGFDVVSIKPGSHASDRYDYRFTPDGFYAQNCPIRALVKFAFLIKDDRLILNLPDDEKALYDIQAKVAENDLAWFKQLSDLQKRPMLQALLVDRLHLKFHWTKKELPVYALVIDKGGLKLANAKPNADGKIQKSQRVKGKFTVTVTGQTTADMFGLLTEMSGRYVVDRTGLTGSYDFTISFGPDPSVAPEGDVPWDGPVIFTALREQLGLALEPSTAILDAIVIDHIEAPVPN